MEIQIVLCWRYASKDEVLEVILDNEKRDDANETMNVF